MAMFDKHKNEKRSEPQAEAPPPPAPVASAARTAMIGRGVRVSGDVTADSNLRIEGSVEGRSIQSAHDVEVGESGRVNASITARTVTIAGEVSGDIAGSEKVMIGKSGRVQGNLVAPRVQLEDGALFRGSIDMNPAAAADEKPAPAKATPIDAGVRKEPGLTLKSN